MEKYSFKWLLRLSNSIFGHEKTRVERKMNLISWENGASFQDQSQSVVILKWNSGLRSTIFNGSTVQMSVESNSDCFGLSLLRDWLRELVRFLLDHSHSKLKPMSTRWLLEVFTLVLIGCERARKRALFFQPIGFKPKPIGVFPRFELLACFYFEFSLARVNKTCALILFNHMQNSHQLSRGQSMFFI